jgi:hypothetical protein
METTILSTPMPDKPQRGVRSTFLMVICILTFIGSGYGIISSAAGYFLAATTGDTAREAMKNAQERIDQQDTPGFIKQIMSSVAEGMSPEARKLTAILKLVSNLFTLFGALLMWNLRKIGFYLYIAGIALLMAAPFAMGKVVGIVSGVFVGIIGIAFIIMYGFNLKDMNKPAN